MVKCHCLKKNAHKLLIKTRPDDANKCCMVLIKNKDKVREVGYRNVSLPKTDPGVSSIYSNLFTHSRFYIRFESIYFILKVFFLAINFT